MSDNKTGNGPNGAGRKTPAMRAKMAASGKLETA